MCGRFVSTSTPEAIAAYFGATADVAPLGANFNVAPTHDVYGVVARAADPDAPLDKTVQAFHWGLIPSWAKERKIGARMINARAETLTEKPSFRGLVKNKRVIIPMDGFYEWKPGATDGPRNAKVGVRSSSPCSSTASTANRSQSQASRAAWKDPSDPDHRWLHSATVITTGANDLMSPVHDRMPVLVPRDRWDEWLDPGNDDIDALVGHLHLLPTTAALKMHAVSAEVNDVRNNAADLLNRDVSRPLSDQSSAMICAAQPSRSLRSTCVSSICKREFAHLVGWHQVNMGVRYLVARNHQPDLFAAEGALLGLGNAAGYLEQVRRQLGRSVDPMIDLLDGYDKRVSWSHWIDRHECNAAIIAMHEGPGNIAVDDHGKTVLIPAPQYAPRTIET